MTRKQLAAIKEAVNTAYATTDDSEDRIQYILECMAQYVLDLEDLVQD